jgi:hypothetical protein
MIDDVARRVDLVACRGRLAFERCRAAADRLEPRKGSGRAANGRPRLVDRIKKCDERQQPERLERATLDGQRGKDLREVLGCAQRQRAVGGKKMRGFGRVREQLCHVLRMGRGLHPAQAFRTHRRQRDSLYGLDDPIEFEA